MVSLIINGKPVCVPEGTSILEAARAANIDIPTLCYLKDLNEIGACRICMVEVEGQDTLVAACDNEVHEGMVVHTNSQKVRMTRRVNLQLLLSQHEVNCVKCTRSGNCKLQKLANDYNLLGAPYQKKLRPAPVDYSAPTGISSKSPEFNELNTFPYVFLLGAAVMIIGMLVILFFVKEPDSRIKVQGEMNQAADAEARRKAEKEAAKAEKEARKKEKLTSGERRSLIFMLMGLFFLFCGTNAISTFFALFADEILHKTAAQATIMTTAFAAASAVAAIPAGWLGKKFGRKKTILGGLAIFIVAFGAYLLTEILHINALSGALIWVALVVGGAANMFITVNTLPLVLEIGGIDKVGTFTGYYYTATFSAQIATPIIYGIVRMLTGTYMSLFYYCPIAFILSTLCILVVRHGEAIPDEIVEKIKEENED